MAVNADTERTIKVIESAAERTVKRVAFEIGNELKRTTPYKIGWAKANWITSIGTPVDAPIGQHDSAGVTSALAQQATGEARLLVYRFNQGNINISNNVPYIQKLNEGHSKQAPAGFVEMAIDHAVKMITGGGAT